MKVILGYLVILTVSTLTTNAEDEFRTTVGGTSYLITYQQQNWFRALKACKQNNMELATINSVEQYENIKQVIQQSNHPTADYWTSGTDLGCENNFFWASNGESFDYQLWHPNQPDNYLNDENCVVMRHWGNIYKFNDFPCDSKIYFICSKVDEIDLMKIIEPRSGGR